MLSYHQVVGDEAVSGVQVDAAASSDSSAVFDGWLSEIQGWIDSSCRVNEMPLN
jgi:hypothetical protein